MAESGYPGFEAGTWYAFLAPAGLQREVQGKLAADIAAVAQMDEVRARFAALGIDTIGNTPGELRGDAVRPGQVGQGDPRRQYQGGLV